MAKRWTVSLPSPDGYDIKPFDTVFHTPQKIVLAADHDAEVKRLIGQIKTQGELLEYKRAEITRLRADLAAMNDSVAVAAKALNDEERLGETGAKALGDAKKEIARLRQELAREEEEHDRCTAFHAIAVKERNHERVLALKRETEITRLREENAKLRGWFDTKQTRALMDEIERLREEFAAERSAWENVVADKHFEIEQLRKEIEKLHGGMSTAAECVRDAHGRE